MAEKQQPHLISGVGKSETIPEALRIEVEPIFLVSISSDLRFPSIYHSVLGDYLSHCIAREPLDLRSHVRRIFLEYSRGRGSELFGALLDLFLALGKKGLSLRRRMLELSQGRLETHQYHLLHESLVEGLDERKLTFITPGSMLCQGTEGGLELIEFGTERTSEPRDPLTEAREYLEYSQIDEARSVLEYALMQDPQRLDLHKELLDIYRSTRDQNNFAKMFERLNGLGNPMSEHWRELAEFLGV